MPGYALIRAILCCLTREVFLRRIPPRLNVTLTLNLLGLVWLVCTLPVYAQDSSDVHVSPSVPAKNTNPAPDPSLNTHTKSLRRDVELVMVPVTVTDPMGQFVLGLDKENFEVHEGKHKQVLRYFFSEDAPVSVGIIFDMSRSMKNKFDKAKEAVIQFMQTANPADEFFVIGFSDRPKLLAAFTSSVDQVQNQLVFTAPGGMTSLLDAIAMGMDFMNHASRQRKALLIISDGGDNHSRYTESEIKSAVEESDIQLFAIGIFDAAPLTPEERDGPALLSGLTNITGGTTFFLKSPAELPDVATKISSQLRQQYVLAFAPLEKRNDGKWHRIRVKLTAPRGFPPLTVHAKQGYYAHE
ncbi:MAG TPA: VWA domain-containing protein [Terriglobales bacterium]|nr:VWA domain-containing protein [Terriglobales bacterium]